MGRIFSLRGTYSITDNIQGPQKLLLDYVSPDRTRAWKIIKAYVWPKDFTGTASGSTDQAGMACFTLWTDTAVTLLSNELMNAADNRQCAWSMQQYNTRDSLEMIFAQGRGEEMPQFTIDPDTLVTKELYLQGQFKHDGPAPQANREWNYLIILESKKVTASESLFQQIKGIGQNIDS